MERDVNLKLISVSEVFLLSPSVIALISSSPILFTAYGIG